MIMLAIFPKKDKLKVGFIILLAGMFIAAITVIKPFILYVKYINALDQDITYLSAPELDWIAECSDSVYNPDHNDLLTRA